VKLATIKFPGSEGKLLIMGIGAGSLVGRILYGKVGELLQMNGIFLQQVCNIYFNSLP
jgi:hypothetical protein